MSTRFFFHKKSDKVYFLTAQYCTSRSLRIIMTALEKVINKYTCRSFNVTDFHGDSEFDKEVLRNFSQPALLHVHAKGEHVAQLRDPCTQIRTCSDLRAKAFHTRG